MGDYDYYEEPQPVPTFSDGSTSGGRGANFRAAASRASASKSAVSAASRASAMIAASIQQLPKNSIITSNGIRNIQSSGPAVNMAAVRAAQKRSEDILKTVKPPEPLIIRQPIEFVAKIPSSTVILETANPATTLNKVSSSSKFTSDIYDAAVKVARTRKEELLTSVEPTIQTKKIYAPIKYIRHTGLIEEQSINKGALDELASNLSTLLRSNDKVSILEEFNKYQTKLRISIEEPYYKNAIQQFRLNKQTYLTSDA